MRRREFFTLIGGAVAWPCAARAQQAAMPIVGLVGPRSPEESTRLVAAFRKALNETGYIEAQNVMVEYHWLEGKYDRLPALMADLVRRRVAVIATPAFTAAAPVAKAATTTIPIVFGVAEDPVKMGLVASLPGQAAMRPAPILASEAWPHGSLHDPSSGTCCRADQSGQCPTAETTLETSLKRHAPSDCKLRSSTPAPAARSRQPSPPSCATGPTPSSSPPTGSSAAGAFNLRRSRRIIGFPRPISCASSSKWAG